MVTWDDMKWLYFKYILKIEPRGFAGTLNMYCKGKKRIRMTQFWACTNRKRSFHELGQKGYERNNFRRKIMSLILGALSLRSTSDIQVEILKRVLKYESRVQEKVQAKDTYKFGDHQCADDFQVRTLDEFTKRVGIEKMRSNKGWVQMQSRDTNNNHYSPLKDGWVIKLAHKGEKLYSKHNLENFLNHSQIQCTWLGLYPKLANYGHGTNRACWLFFCCCLVSCLFLWPVS